TVSRRRAILTVRASRRESSLSCSEPDVLIKRLDPSVPLPSYSHPGDAGADLAVAEDVELGPGERALVRTGLAIALPAGYAGLVHPRSGLRARHGVAVRFARAARIAQLVIQGVERALFHEVEVLPGSSRGDGGHGPTGGHSGEGP